jgi:hypothetical protein
MQAAYALGGRFDPQPDPRYEAAMASLKHDDMWNPSLHDSLARAIVAAMDAGEAVAGTSVASGGSARCR